MNLIRKLLLALTAVAALGTFVTVPARAMDDAARQEIEKIVRDYLLANPDILLEMRDTLEAKRRAEQEEKQRLTLAREKDAIYAAKDQIVIGAPDAALTIVEFFDYNCSFCQRALEDMNRLLDGGNGVRFIMKEFPVLGDDSVAAARISIAFNRLMPEKAPEFHRALLGAPGHKDGQMALDLAVKLGADAEKVKAEAAKDETGDTIAESYRLGDGLGISGTPSYIVGNEIVFGAVGFDNLSTKIANLGTCGKTIC